MCSLQGDYVITAKRAEKITIVEERHLLFKKKKKGGFFCLISLCCFPLAVW